jgi:hypothetical protein
MVWWALGLAVMAIVAWLLVPTVLTFVVPETYSGRRYLEKQLRFQGISTTNLAPAFFHDCIRWAQQVSMVTKLEGRGEIARKAEFVRALDTLAQMAALWRRDPNSAMFKSHSLSKSTYRELFEKHGL